METMKYGGHDCVLLENNSLRLIVTRSIGPRILAFGSKGGENLFAELPNFVTECPGVGTFHFRGGHRLWHAPESLNRTYLPDDAPVEISAIENGIRVTQNIEVQTGLQKSIEIRLQDESRVEVTHRIANHGLWDVTCAAWAITQFKPGGVAILPQAQDKTGLLPNRSLALWEYTDMSSPNVTWGWEYILVQAHMQSAFKIGFSNPRGWLAYWLYDSLFVKRAQYEAQSAYYDFGSSCECYCNEQFLELETLSPIHTIAPSATITHVETWELFSNIERPRTEAEAHALVGKINLDNVIASPSR